MRRRMNPGAQRIIEALAPVRRAAIRGAQYERIRQLTGVTSTAAPNRQFGLTDRERYLKMRSSGGSDACGH